MHCISNKNSQLLVDDEDIIKGLREYIEKLYDGEQLEVLTTNEEETNLSILKSEIELALYDLKQNKVSEIDNIAAKLLQCAGMKKKKALYKLTRDLYAEG